LSQRGASLEYEVLYQIIFYTNLLKTCSFNENISTRDNAGSREALMPSRNKELKMI